ncbi:hypothetical protein QJ043_06910 [Olsenella sp. YH-ols2217]|uniref:Uncharacterized protein n=1 Tax=Kribbibacterium absianum TaxID=3044210 RepID=A0ABT6ZLY4_9ACTN|nr:MULTISPECIES: hypothetical protein [unclassified Olsenella]MDJ1121796.1 hypothetical protein [Olsenella sp. YH-ols2216]MDJ1129804.1 hypothetical protein [Olsenella sp. YH-ols2217]
MAACAAALLVVVLAAGWAAREGTGGQAPRASDEQAQPRDGQPVDEPEDGAAADDQGGAPVNADDLWSRALADGRATRTEREFPSELPDAAATVLEEYRTGSWQLLQAGYLDLLGRCWGCVAMAPDKVQVCVLSETDLGTSHADVLALSPKDWQDGGAVGRAGADALTEAA